MHTTSIHQNVISVGSFDRFAYGEEEDKGFYIVKRDDTGKYAYEFVKNEHAIPFWTLNLKDFDNQDIRPVIDHVDSIWGPKIRRAREMKLPVHVRLVTNNSGIMDGMTQYLRDTYPHIAVDRGVATKKEQILEKVAMDLSELPVITPDNVADLAIPAEGVQAMTGAAAVEVQASVIVAIMVHGHAIGITVISLNRQYAPVFFLQNLYAGLHGELLVLSDQFSKHRVPPEEFFLSVAQINQICKFLLFTY